MPLSDYGVGFWCNQLPPPVLYQAPLPEPVPESLCSTSLRKEKLTAMRNGAERREWSAQEDELVRSSVPVSKVGVQE